MSEATDHFTRLDDDLREHERRMDTIRQQIEQLNDELVIHETVLELGRSERVRNAVRRMLEAADESEVTEGTVSAELEDAGVVLPEGTIVRIGEKDDGGQVIEGLFVSGSLDYTITLDTRTGFSVSPGHRHSVGGEAEA
jgi:seryl-tRNA synthetase